MRDLLRGNLRDFLREPDAKVGLTFLTLRAAQEGLFAALSKRCFALLLNWSVDLAGGFYRIPDPGCL